MEVGNSIGRCPERWAVRKGDNRFIGLTFNRHVRPPLGEEVRCRIQSPPGV